MNSGPLLFLGILFTLASSFWGLVLAPQLQIGRQPLRTIEATGQIYPSGRPGLAQEGAEVYRANGCAECHTQQVRPRGFGADFERGWGRRRTVAQDYLHDYPVLLGQLRIGPDLANIGVRETDALKHLKHLFNPKLTAPGSMMPPYRYLFEKRKLKPGQSASPDALPLGNEVEDGHEIRPRPEANALVAYLLSLHSEAPLFEAPLPQTPTNAAPNEATSTNTGPTTSTNTSPTNAATNLLTPVPAK